MDWAASEWKEGLSNVAKQKVCQLEEQLEKNQKVTHQRQLQSEQLEQALQNQRKKTEEEKSLSSQLSRDLQILAEKHNDLGVKYERLQHAVNMKENQLNSLEGQLGLHKKTDPVNSKDSNEKEVLLLQIKELQQELQDLRAKCSQLELTQKGTFSGDVGLAEKIGTPARGRHGNVDDMERLKVSKELAESQIKNLEQKLVQLGKELDCQRHNYEASKTGLEAKFKEKENEFQEDLRQQIQANAHISKILEETKLKFQQEQLKVNSLESHKSQLEKEAANLQKAENEIRQQQQLVLAKDREILDLENTSQEMKKSLQHSEKCVSSLQARADNAEAKLKTQSDQIKNLEGELSSKDKQLGKLEQTILDKDNAASCLKNKLDATEQKNAHSEDSLKNKISTLEKDLRTAETDLNTTRKDLERATSFEEKCKVLAEKLSGVEHSVAEKEKTYQSMKSQLDSLKSSSEEQRITVHELKEKNSEFNLQIKAHEKAVQDSAETENRLNKTVSDKQKDIQVLENKISSLTTSIQEKDCLLANLRDELKEKDSDFSKCKKESNELINQLQTLLKEKEIAIESSSKEYSITKTECEALNSELALKRETFNTLKKNFDDMNVTYETMKERYSSLEEQRNGEIRNCQELESKCLVLEGEQTSYLTQVQDLIMENEAKDRDVEEHKKQLSKASMEMEERLKSLSDVEETLKNIKSCTSEEINVLRTQLTEKQAESSQIQLLLTEKESTIVLATEEFSKIKADYEIMNNELVLKHATMEILQRDFDDTNTAYESLKRNLSALEEERNVDTLNFQEVKNKYLILEEQIISYSTQIQLLKNEAEEKDRMIVELEKRLSEVSLELEEKIKLLSCSEMALISHKSSMSEEMNAIKVQLTEKQFERSQVQDEVIALKYSQVVNEKDLAILRTALQEAKHKVNELTQNLSSVSIVKEQTEELLLKQTETLTTLTEKAVSLEQNECLLRVQLSETSNKSLKYENLISELRRSIENMEHLQEQNAILLEENSVLSKKSFDDAESIQKHIDELEALKRSHIENIQTLQEDFSKKSSLEVATLQSALQQSENTLKDSTNYCFELENYRNTLQKEIDEIKNTKEELATLLQDMESCCIMQIQILCETLRGNNFPPEPSSLTIDNTKFFILNENFKELITTLYSYDQAIRCAEKNSKESFTLQISKLENDCQFYSLQNVQLKDELKEQEILVSKLTQDLEMSEKNHVQQIEMMTGQISDQQKEIDKNLEQLQRSNNVVSVLEADLCKLRSIAASEEALQLKIRQLEDETEKCYTTNTKLITELQQKEIMICKLESNVQNLEQKVVEHLNLLNDIHNSVASLHSILLPDDSFSTDSWNKDFFLMMLEKLKTEVISKEDVIRSMTEDMFALKAKESDSDSVLDDLLHRLVSMKDHLTERLGEVQKISEQEQTMTLEESTTNLQQTFDHSINPISEAPLTPETSLNIQLLKYMEYFIESIKRFPIAQIPCLEDLLQANFKLESVIQEKQALETNLDNIKQSCDLIVNEANNKVFEVTGKIATILGEKSKPENCGIQNLLDLLELKISSHEKNLSTKDQVIVQLNFTIEEIENNLQETFEEKQKFETELLEMKQCYLDMSTEKFEELQKEVEHFQIECVQQQQKISDLSKQCEQLEAEKCTLLGSLEEKRYEMLGDLENCLDKKKSECQDLLQKLQQSDSSLKQQIEFTTTCEMELEKTQQKCIELEKEASEKRNELAALLFELVQIKGQLELANEHAKETETDLLELDEIKSENRSLKVSVTILENKIKENETQLDLEKKANLVDTLEQELNILQQNQCKLEGTLKSKEDEVTNLTLVKKDLEKRIAELQDSCAKFEEKLSTLSDAVDLLEHKILKLETENNLLDQSKNELLETNGKLEGQLYQLKWENELSEKDLKNKINELESRNSETSLKLETAEKLLSSKEEACKRFTAEITDWQLLVEDADRSEKILLTEISNLEVRLKEKDIALDSQCLLKNELQETANQLQASLDMTTKDKEHRLKEQSSIITELKTKCDRYRQDRESFKGKILLLNKNQRLREKEKITLQEELEKMDNMKLNLEKEIAENKGVVQDSKTKIINLEKVITDLKSKYDIKEKDFSDIWQKHGQMSSKLMELEATNKMLQAHISEMKKTSEYRTLARHLETGTTSKVGSSMSKSKSETTLPPNTSTNGTEVKRRLRYSTVFKSPEEPVLTNSSKSVRSFTITKVPHTLTKPTASTSLEESTAAKNASLGILTRVDKSEFKEPTAPNTARPTRRRSRSFNDAPKSSRTPLSTFMLPSSSPIQKKPRLSDEPKENLPVETRSEQLGLEDMKKRSQPDLVGPSRHLTRSTTVRPEHYQERSQFEASATASSKKPLGFSLEDNAKGFNSLRPKPSGRSKVDKPGDCKTQ